MPMPQSTIYDDYWSNRIDELRIVRLFDPISNLPGFELLKHRCVEKYTGDPTGPQVIVTMKKSIGEHPGCDPILFVKLSDLPQYCTFPENTEPAATGQGVVSADFSTPTGERPSRARRGSPR